MHFIEQVLAVLYVELLFNELSFYAVSRIWIKYLCSCVWLWRASVKLVEQELWQREEKGLIGILPVRDAAAETSSAGSLPSPGDKTAF